jgi:hypothetical protein
LLISHARVGASQLTAARACLSLIESSLDGTELHMNTLRVGTYVTHAKLPDLGSGEIIASDGQSLVIRFASCEKNFVAALTEKHLTVTAEAPVLTKPARASKSKAPRAKKATSKAAPAPEPEQ